MAKSPKQLDREIAEALSGGSGGYVMAADRLGQRPKSFPKKLKHGAYTATFQGLDKERFPGDTLVSAHWKITRRGKEVGTMHEGSAYGWGRPTASMTQLVWSGVIPPGASDSRTSEYGIAFDTSPHDSYAETLAAFARAADRLIKWRHDHGYQAMGHTRAGKAKRTTRGGAHSTIKTDEQWEAQVAERRKRDPGAWSSRAKLVSIARAAANNVFSGRKVMTPALIKKAEAAAFKAIRRYDPLAGTSDHPAAAYSHGVAELAAEGTAQAERTWAPEKKIPYGTWAKAGQKLVSHDKRFSIIKDKAGGYNLIDLDTYNEYPAATIDEAKSKARQLRY